jgi:hypothetical protein
MFVTKWPFLAAQPAFCSRVVYIGWFGLSDRSLWAGGPNMMQRERMMKTNTLMSLLLLTAVCATPASANYFSNTKWNTMLNIGSAPSPTPAQLRAIGDSSYASAPVRRTLNPRAEAVPPSPAVQEPVYDNDDEIVNSYDEEIVGSNSPVVAPTRVAVGTKSTTTTKVAATKVVAKKAMVATPATSLAKMEGKPVFGSKGERLGYVLAVNEKAHLIDMQLPSGIAVSMPGTLVTDKGSRAIAPTVTKADTMDMAKSQTGRMTALNMIMKNGKLSRA